LYTILCRLLNSGIRKEKSKVHSSSVSLQLEYICAAYIVKTSRQTHSHKRLHTHNQIIKSLNKHFYRLAQVKREKSVLPFCGQLCCVRDRDRDRDRCRGRNRGRDRVRVSKCQSCTQYIISNRCICMCLCVR